MTSVTQNLGELDNNQNTDGFSPGAQAVDLRGLGPNHTLVLVNGRRIADYPQAYGGNSNFTDISNIPASLIDRVEILSGSASAVYGSDAISGVINFILKQKADGTTVDFRDGDTATRRRRFAARADYLAAIRTTVSTRYSAWSCSSSSRCGRISAASPTRGSDSPQIRMSIASPVFMRIDVDGNYLDPGKATCDALSHLDHGSVMYLSRPGYAADGRTRATTAAATRRRLRHAGERPQDGEFLRLRDVQAH